jgi:hypothetical protein
LHVFRAAGVSGRVKRRGFDAHRWLAPSGLAALPHGGPTRKALALLGEASALSHRNRLREATRANPD